MVGEQFQQGRLVLGEAKEMILLADPVRFRAMDRTQAEDEVLVLLEGLTRHAIPPLVVPLVDIPGRSDAPDQLLDASPVSRLGRPDEVVKGEVEPPPDIEELAGHAVAVREGLLAELLRHAKHVLRVLVVAHHEVDVDTRRAACSAR